MNAPPTDKPLSLLRVCHSCFLLRSAGGTTLLIDPYFGGPFRWKAHDEKHLSPPPALKVEEVKKLDGIVITHDHPDHCQPDALYSLMSRNRCGLWGPSGIYRRAVEVGIDNRRVTKIDAFQRFKIGDVEILALPNKGSEDTKPCMRMSYLFSCKEISVFHGGDSHGPSPSWSGHVDGVSLALLWPNHVERAVSFIKPESVALMHCDRFEPGDFLCGYDEGEVRERLRKRSRGSRILGPAAGEWFWPERPSEEELRRMRERPRGRRRGRDRRGRKGSRGGGTAPREEGDAAAAHGDAPAESGEARPEKPAGEPAAPQTQEAPKTGPREPRPSPPAQQQPPKTPEPELPAPGPPADSEDPGGPPPAGNQS
ncbi:MAG: MBL fold metallo-hydrolase [Planctomycetota bacterium]|jgi:L-ascorbate metabolism protein UlaG (beta-lactamase superfamily)